MVSGKVPLTVLCVLFLACAAVAQETKKIDDSVKDGVTVRGLTVTQDMGKFGFYSDANGTFVYLVAVSREKTIIRKSDYTLESFTDDKGTDLSDGGTAMDHDTYPVSESGHSMGFSAQSKLRPARGATAVKLKGKVVVLTGENLQNLVVKDVEIKNDAKVQIGKVTAVIKSVQVQELGTMCLLVCEEPLDFITTVFLVEADGKETKISPFGPYKGKWDDKIVYNLQLSTDKKLEKATLKFRCYEKTQSLTFPFDLTVGIGLQLNDTAPPTVAPLPAPPATPPPAKASTEMPAPAKPAATPAATDKPLAAAKPSLSSPAEAFTNFTSAVKQGEWGSAFDCMTEDGQAMLAYGAVFALDHVSHFSGQWKTKAHDIAEKHGVGEKAMEDRERFSDMSQDFKVIVAMTTGKRAFCIEALGLCRQHDADFMAGPEWSLTLGDVVAKGDSATGAAAKTSSPARLYDVSFKKVAGVWLLVDCPRRAIVQPVVAPGDEQLITLGEGYGKFRLGMTDKEVKAALGKPHDIFAGVMWNYPDRGVRISFAKDDMRADALTMGDIAKDNPYTIAFEGKTAEGTGVGSSEDDVVKAYGDPTRSGSDTTGHKHLEYPKLRTMFWLMDGHVTQIVTRRER